MLGCESAAARPGCSAAKAADDGEPEKNRLTSRPKFAAPEPLTASGVLVRAKVRLESCAELPPVPADEGESWTCGTIAGSKAESALLSAVVAVCAAASFRFAAPLLDFCEARAGGAEGSSVALGLSVVEEADESCAHRAAKLFELLPPDAPRTKTFVSEPEVAVPVIVVSIAKGTVLVRAKCQDSRMWMHLTRQCASERKTRGEEMWNQVRPNSADQKWNGNRRCDGQALPRKRQLLSTAEAGSPQNVSLAQEKHGVQFALFAPCRGELIFVELVIAQTLEGFAFAPRLLKNFLLLVA